MKKALLTLLALLCALLCACGKETVTGGGTMSARTARETSPAEGRELMALADSGEQARLIAETYGIELVEYELGVAVYHTEEDPLALIRRGEERGWPALEINFVNRLDPVEIQERNQPE